MIMVKKNLRGKPWVIASVVLSGLMFLSDFATAQAPFYKDKTIVIIQGRRPGGLGDLRTRAIMSLLAKYIPGNPTIVAKYIPGGGGRKAANHLYRSVRRDGLTLANIGSGFVTNGIMGARGVKYDVDKFIYLGSGNSKTNYVFATRSASGFDTLEKLQTTPGVRVGAGASPLPARR